MDFPMFAHSYGIPHDIFSFFSDIMWWLKYRGIAFKKEIGSFFIFSYHFLTIFASFSNIWLFGPFCPFCTPPWATPHHQWPKFQFSCPLNLISPWVTLLLDIINDFQIFSWKWPFSHFWPFWCIRTPLYGRALTEWGFGEHFYGP